MPYVVKAGSGNLGEGTVTLHKETRYAASELRDFLNEDH
jgi:hypothetical protein